MAESNEEETDEKPKGSKLPLVLGVILALVGGGGSFYAVSSGLLFGSDETDPHVEQMAEDEIEMELPEIAFVALDPMLISLGPNSRNRHLKFRAQLEVPPKYQSDVSALTPRIVDVLNSYLRAVETSDLEDPTILLRLRSQMLRRIQLVAGPGRISDLLIMEFVLS